MYDTDTAQILFFGSQFRFMNDALEDLMAEHGITMESLFNGSKDYGFVFVHAESDYIAPLRVGDKISVQVIVSKIGETSFEFSFTLLKTNTQEVVGKGKTNHVTINKKSFQKIKIPDELRLILEHYQKADA